MKARVFGALALAGAIGLAGCTSEHTAALDAVRATAADSMRDIADTEARAIKDLICRPRVGALIRTSTSDELIDTLARCGMPPESLAAALVRRGVVITLSPR